MQFSLHNSARRDQVSTSKKDVSCVVWSSCLKKRLDAHNGVINGGAKYTKCRRPVCLVYYESFQSKQEAQSREYAIKRLNRIQKLQLIASGENREIERINLLK